jgi:hypothetical protein
MTKKNIAKCVTCGDELHPERARKYNYCMSPECQAKNLKGLTMVAVGVNKSAEQYLLLDDETKADLADGKYHDQRRGTFGRTAPAPTSSAPAATSPDPAATAASSTPPAPAARPATGTSPRPSRPAPARPAGPRQPGTPSQRRLAVLYNQQGQRPDEIASKLGLTRYEVTQIILAARTQGKL